MSNGLLPRTCSSRSEFAVKATCVWNRCPSELAPQDAPRLAPCAQVDRAHHDAEHVSRNEAQLVLSESDNADEYAIDASQGPSLPNTAAQPGSWTRRSVRKIDNRAATRSPWPLPDRVESESRQDLRTMSVLVVEWNSHLHHTPKTKRRRRPRERRQVETSSFLDVHCHCGVARFSLYPPSESGLLISLHAPTVDASTMRNRSLSGSCRPVVTDYERVVCRTSGEGEERGRYASGVRLLREFNFIQELGDSG